MTTDAKLRTVIVDDEELARGVLREMAAVHAVIDIVAECANGFEAVKAILELKPDLVFLDVQMPKLDGFEVLELTGADMAIVFVTAYDQYALRAFEVHAVDYLLKPFTADRFETALTHARQRYQATVEQRSQPQQAFATPIGPPQLRSEAEQVWGSSPRKFPTLAELAAAAREPGRYLDRIVVRDGTRVTIIPLTRFDFAEAQDDYVAIVSQGHRHLKQQTIASLEAALDPARFVRIHRSYLVNLERVAKVEPYGKDSRVAVLSDGTRLPVSRAGYTRLCTALEGKP